MGTSTVDCEVVSPRQLRRSVTVARLLVDSGSEFTWVPEPALRRVGISIAKKDLRFIKANRQAVSRSTGYAIVRAAGFETVDEVVFGQAGDLFVLGARTLEGFRARVDVHKKRLVAAGPHPDALSAPPPPSRTQRPRRPLKSDTVILRAMRKPGGRGARLIRAMRGTATTGLTTG